MKYLLERPITKCFSTRWFCILFAIVCTTICGPSSRLASAETWAERLGFPADKKVIILHAQEMGICHAANAAAEQLHDSELTISSSVMVPCPWFLDYAAWSRDHQNADVGLALTINSELANHRWQPLSPQNEVPSLVDSEGDFWPSTTQTMVNGSVEEVERELHRQIQRALRSGIKPTHLTTHMGTLFMRLDLTEVYLRLARQYWIPAVVIELTSEHVERFQLMGHAVPEELIELLDSYPLPKVDDLQFVPPAETYEAMHRSVLNLIRELPPGLTQVAFAPARESDELKRVVPDWQQRVWVAQLLKDPEIRALLNGEDVILTTWREIMERFTGHTPN